MIAATAAKEAASPAAIDLLHKKMEKLEKDLLMKPTMGDDAMPTIQQNQNDMKKELVEV